MSETAAVDPVDSLTNALLCPITLQRIQDPVCTIDGHTFERSAVERWIESNTTSPLTGLALSSTELTPNYAFKSVIECIGPFLELLNRFKEEADKADGEVDHVQRFINKVEGLEAIISDLKALQLQLESKDDEVFGLENEFESRFESQKSDIDALKAHRAHIIKDLTFRRSQMELLEAEYANVKLEVNFKTTQLNEMITANSDLESQLESKENELFSRVCDLERQIEARTKEKEQLKVSNAGLREQNALILHQKQSHLERVQSQLISVLLEERGRSLNGDHVEG
ncbi:hypothetical protein HDU98_006812 [Podochytrium sp. JEL0797]|nr:hypothetical protein HDU98_006812 [Podochytrium sp. JEL0797]